MVNSKDHSERDQTSRTDAPQRSIDRPDAGPFPTKKASEIEPEEVTWLWEKRIPRGKLTALCGNPETGKTRLTLDLAARLSRGGPLPGEQAAADDPQNTLILNDEDGHADTIRPCLDRFNADLERVRLMTPESLNFGSENHRNRFVQTLRQHDTDLAVIDPLASYCTGMEANSDEGVRAVLKPLAKMAQQTGTAIVFIRHLRKQEARKALFRLSGSVAFVAACRSAILVGNTREGQAVAVLKSNIAKKPPVLGYEITDQGLTWKGAIPLSTRDLLDPGTSNQRSPRERAKKFLIQTLATGPKRAKEVKRLADKKEISTRTLGRAREDLGITQDKGCVKPDGFQGPSTWELPDALRGDSVAKPGSESPQDDRDSSQNLEASTSGEPSEPRHDEAPSQNVTSDTSGEASDDPGDQQKDEVHLPHGSPPSDGSVTSRGEEVV